MQAVYLFTYKDLESFDFQHLPKGNMLELFMNPYNGKVYLKPEKHKASTRVTLDIMREVVRLCGHLERNGSDDPLRDLLSLVDGENWESLSNAAKADVLAFVGRSGENEDNEAAEGCMAVEKAS